MRVTNGAAGLRLSKPYQTSAYRSCRVRFLDRWNKALTKEVTKCQKCVSATRELNESKVALKRALSLSNMLLDQLNHQGSN